MLADRRNAINVENAVQMVVFVLNDAGKEAFEHLFVFHEIGVEPIEPHFFEPRHGFAQSGEAEAAFRTRNARTAVFQYVEFGIDKRKFHAGQFRVSVFKHVGIDYDQADRQADLGRGKTHAALRLRQSVGAQAVRINKSVVSYFHLSAFQIVI